MSSANRDQALYQKAVKYLREGRHEQALKNLRPLLKKHPENGDLINAAAICLIGLGKKGEARQFLARALAAKIYDQRLFLSLGNVCIELGEAADALGYLTQGLSHFPQSMELNIAAMIAERTIGDFAKAIERCDMLIAHQPDEARLWVMRSEIMLRTGQPDEAMAAAGRAVEINPDHPSGYINLANAHAAQNNFAQAAQLLSGKAAQFGQNKDYKNILSLALLSAGDYQAGFKHTSELACHFDPLYTALKARAGCADWTGQKEQAAASILVYGDQGLGDIIQFSRYLPLLQACFAKVYVALPASLDDLILQSLPGLVKYDRQSAITCSVPISALPHFFATGKADIPAPLALSCPPPDKPVEWASGLNRTQRRAGLVWRGNPDHVNDHNRSLPLSEMLGWLDPDTDYFILQTELAADEQQAVSAMENMHLPKQKLAKFTDTFHLVSQLDYVITVDTSLAHLAGSMGKQTCLLLPFRRDWRWQYHEAGTSWYDSISIISQSAPGQWDQPLARLKELSLQDRGR